MSVVCALDVHRQALTFGALESDTGEVLRGRVWQPDQNGSRAG